MDATRLWDPADWVNQGGSILSQDPRLAQRLIAQGLRCIPNEPIPWFNLGIALHQQRRIAAAIRAYERSLALPGAPLLEAGNNLAQDLLLLGHFNEGWKRYEHRLLRPKYDYSYFRGLAGEAWQGFADPRPCRRLIVVAEQGFGDTLQFCRLVFSLQRQGLETLLFSQPALVPLLQESSDLGSVSSSAASELFDGQTLWCPLLSLPHRLGLHANNIPMPEGYLRPDSTRVERWRQTLQRKPQHRLVALHWQGNPKHEGSLYSRGRSMVLQQWMPLAQVPGIEWVSIQKGAGSEQLSGASRLPWVAGQPEVSASLDFRDTAAVLANCDLLISADSGVVHLAGAMGVPTWVALRWIPEWRWGLTGTEGPWYSSVRLFRQPWDGDWISVVQEIKGQLEQLG